MTDTSPTAPRAPRITFGMIVLNGEPFLCYNLRGLYTHAHQIIVVEGAAPGARNIADAEGHSRDGTLDALRRFKVQEDPENKIVIVTAEDEGHPNGFWPGEKDEQSRAYAKRATGDYLWQVDVDEFYRAEDIEAVASLLRREPGVTAVSFHQITFWGGFDYVADGWYLRRGAAAYHRLFKWGKGYDYVAHRPPTVRDAQGRDLRELQWLDDKVTAARGIFLYHYSLLLPKQVEEKCDYYQNAEWSMREGAVDWAREAFDTLRRPFRVHNVYQFPSWLERYGGSHPEQIQRLRHDIGSGALPVTLRRTDDIERLLASSRYRLLRFFVICAGAADSILYRLGRRLRRLPGIGPALGALRRLTARTPSSERQDAR